VCVCVCARTITIKDTENLIFKLTSLWFMNVFIVFKCVDN